MREYADPVIDWLDAGSGILNRRLFREVNALGMRGRPRADGRAQSCTPLNGQYTKDLSLIEADLSRVCLLDNSPVCYSLNEGGCRAFASGRRSRAAAAANGIPIEGWTHDPLDEALLDLLPVLDSLRFTSDVRRVLGIRGFA
jgi:CTD nuclear envelope phosphatase 1